MINEKMLEFLCLNSLLMDQIIDGDWLTNDEFFWLRERYIELRKELISQYVKDTTQK